MGLANRVVATGTSLEHATRLAHEIASRPQAALRSDRLSSYEQWSLALRDAIANEYEHGMATLRTGELDEGLAATRAGMARSVTTAGDVVSAEIVTHRVHSAARARPRAAAAAQINNMPNALRIA